MNTAYKGYRSMTFAIAVAVVGALQGLDWVRLLPENPQAVGYVITGLGIVFAGLRYITDTPVGKNQ